MTTPRLAVSAAFALNGALFGIWAARIPAFVERFDLTADTLGFLLLCIAGGGIGSFPLAGRLSDRIGAAGLTKIVLPFYVLAFVALPLMPSVPLLAVGLGLFGAMYGTLDVAMNGWAAEVERATGRPIMSSFHAVFSLGAGMGAGTGWFAAGLPIPLLAHFVGLALPLTLCVLFAIRIAWTSRIRDDGPTFALPRGALALVGLVAFAAALGEGAMADWAAVTLVDIHGATQASAALGYASFSAAMVVMRLLADDIIGRVGPVPAVRAGGVAAAFGIVTLIFAPNAITALSGFVLLGLGYAAVFPIALSRAAADPHIPAGRAIASVVTLGYGGMLLGPPVIGWIAATASLSAGLAVIGALAIVMTALAGSVRPA